MFVELAKTRDILPGGMKMAKSGSAEIVLCNSGGKFYALDRRCGHMNAGLEWGSLDGTILTCPYHHVQFDIVTGEALNVPMADYIPDPLPPNWKRFLDHRELLTKHVSICDIGLYPVKVEGESIMVDIDARRSSGKCF